MASLHRRISKPAIGAIRPNVSRASGLSLGFRGHKLPYSFARDLAAVSALHESHLTNPLSLMLDGSNIPENQVPIKSEQAEIQDRRWRGVPRNRDDYLEDRELPSTPIVESSSKVSFDMVRSRLGNERSDNYAKQVSSALSATDSRRSSVASLTGSLKSCQISTTQEYAIHSQEPGTLHGSEPVMDLVSRQKDFSEAELEIWSELVDETHCASAPLLGSAPKVLPRFASQVGVGLATRTCCKMPDIGDFEFRCHFCGFTQTHHLAKLSLGRILRNTHALNERDYFGNTLLHCAVATGEMNLIGIRYLIEQGVNTDATNTFGETFLHLVKLDDSASIADYISLIQFLSRLDFPFWKRDVHGRTFLHVLFESPPIQFLQGGILGQILSIVGPNLQDMDNQGHTLQKVSDMKLGTRSFVSSLDSFAYVSLEVEIPLLRDPRPVDGRSWRDIWSNHKEWGSLNSGHYDILGRRLDWIDSAGENILSSLLKLHSWNNRNDESDLLEKLRNLLEHGASMRMRDKEGNTPLAIATTRGLRPALSILLSSEANYNVRNYEGTGVLPQASLHMLEASRAKDDRRYAMILSCFTLLVESGAKAEPTQWEEWIDRSHREMRTAANDEISSS